MKRVRFWGAVVFSASAMLLALCYMLRPEKLENRLTAKLAALVGAAFLPWFINGLQSIKFGGWEVTRMLETQDEKIAEQQQRIDDQQETINDLVLRSMEPDMYDTLSSLEKYSDFTMPSKDDPVNDLITRQIDRLYDWNYVSRRGEEISEHEQIGGGQIVTEQGRKYLRARRSLEERLPVI